MRGNPAHSGFTLLELLLVMVLIGILLGVGLGAFASLELEGAQAADVVKGALRAGRNAAVARRAPARVRIAPGGRTLTPLGLVVLGTWHFETAELEGARGIRGAGSGFRLTEDGYMGKALALPVGKRAQVSFPIHEDPAFDFAEGFSVECALARDAEVSAHVLSVGSSLGLFVRADGLVRAWFVPQAREGPASGAKSTLRAGGEVVVESEPGLLRLGTWARLRATFDGRWFRLFVDGVLTGEREETGRVWRVEGPLVIGGGAPSFAGRIDNLVLSAWVPGDAWELGEGIAIAQPAPREIAFDASGRLDREVHAEPPLLRIALEDGRKLSLGVSVWGTVE